MSIYDNSKSFLSRNQKTLFAIGSFLLALIFIYLAVKDVELQETFKLISQTNYFYAALYLIVLFCAHYTRALRWKFLIENIKNNVSTGNLFGGLMIGYALNSALPRVGEIARAALAAKKENISFSATLGSIFLDRALDIIFLGFFLLIGFFFFSTSFLEKISWINSSLIYLFIILAFCVITIYLFAYQKRKLQKISSFIFSKISTRLEAKLSNLINRLMDGFFVFKDKKKLIAIIFQSILIYFFYAACSYIGFYFIDLKVNNWTLLDGWIVMTITSFANLIPTPGAIGSYHIIAISILKTLYGIDNNLALVYALTTHFLSYFGTASVGFVYYFAWGGSKVFVAEKNLD